MPGKRALVADYPILGDGNDDNYFRHDDYQLIARDIGKKRLYLVVLRFNNAQAV